MDQAELLAQVAAEFSAGQGVVSGNWFGLPCLKVGGKVFAAAAAGGVAFKLGREAHAEALRIDGARLFDPRRTGRPMRAWVQVPAAQSAHWPRLARLACDFVAGQAQATKDGLFAGLVAARQAVLAAAAAVPPAERGTAFLGQWSLVDLLAHLVGWDHTNRAAVGEILDGQRPAFWAHYDQDWRSYNALLVARHRREDFDQLLEDLGQSHRDLLAYLESIPAREFLKRSSIGALLRAESEDETVHAGQIQAFARQIGAAR